MVSKIKVDEIESSQSGGNVSMNTSLNLKSYTTTEREALSASEGDMVYDTTLNKAYIYTTQWEKFESEPPWTAVGGTKTTDGIYTVHTFTSTGTFVVTGGGSKTVEYLVVAGGGGGGYNRGGGGGAGGYRSL